METPSTQEVQHAPLAIPTQGADATPAPAPGVAGDVLTLITDWLRGIEVELSPAETGAIAQLAETLAARFATLNGRQRMRLLGKVPGLLGRLSRLVLTA